MYTCVLFYETQQPPSPPRNNEPHGAHSTMVMALFDPTQQQNISGRYRITFHIDPSVHSLHANANTCGMSLYSIPTLFDDVTDDDVVACCVCCSAVDVEDCGIMPFDEGGSDKDGNNPIKAPVCTSLCK